MKRFVFKLGALLELRKQHEEKIKLLLAEKNREIIGKNNELNEYYTQLKTLQASEKERRSDETRPVLLRYSVVYRYRLKEDILQTGRSIDTLRNEAALIQQDLIKATKSRRALEMLREKQFVQWKKAYHRKEQEFIDDVAQRSYGNGQ